MSDNPLGKPTQYIDQYDPSLLFAIARKEKRDELNQQAIAFTGEDIWNAYELSWLDLNGVPKVAIATIIFSADSQYIVESKSLKLYFNSLNQTAFANKNKVREVIAKDLCNLTKSKVAVHLYAPNDVSSYQVGQLEGECIDEQNISISSYDYQPSLLKLDTNKNNVKEVLVSHLLKSNCLITSQPDWASIQIKYEGSKICKAALLQYLVSFRSHNEFHEQCVERIFSDIKQICKPNKLTVYARYTRRGGLDINPWRSDFEFSVENIRLSRQ